MDKQFFEKRFPFVPPLWAFVILFRKSNKITLIVDQQHVNNCLHSREKRISLFQYFPCIFWSVFSSCVLYPATMKTVLSCFEEIWKSYYLSAKDRQETGWTKSYYDATVHPWHHWFLDPFVLASNESTISSNISIIFFGWVSVALAFRIFSVFRFPCTCLISSETDFVVVENLNYFHGCSKRESNSLKTSCLHVRWTNTWVKTVINQRQFHGRVCFNVLVNS